MTYTHKLTKQTLKTIKLVEGGVLFLIVETGETKEMTNYQIEKILMGA